MRLTRITPATAIAIAVLNTSVAFAQNSTLEKLQSFSSKEGGFTVLMPAKPVYSSKKMPGKKGRDPVIHHQFTAGQKTGVFMVTYESLTGVKLDTPESLEAAYVRAQRGMQKILGGEVLEYKHSKLDKKRTGRFVRISIPARKGEYRARMFIVGDTLYQVFAMGSEDFAKAKQVEKVLASFKLVKKKNENVDGGRKKKTSEKKVAK